MFVNPLAAIFVLQECQPHRKLLQKIRALRAGVGQGNGSERPTAPLGALTEILRRDFRDRHIDRWGTRPIFLMGYRTGRTPNLGKQSFR